MKPLISVIVPAYNQARFLPMALDSIIAQTYEHWECIIVNDGATDNTEEVALAYAQKDQRFIYLKKENGGLSSARNKGLETAKGEWAQFLDSDDYLAPEKFQLSINLINANNELDLVVSNFRMFTDTPADATFNFCEINQQRLNFEDVLFGWDKYMNIPIHCGLFKAVNFEPRPFNEDLKAKEDWIMWLNLFQKNIKAVYLDQMLAYYRFNDASMTKDKVFLHANRIEAYKYIIARLPDTYKERFTFHVLDLLKSELINYENDVRHYSKKLGYRIKEKLSGFFKK